MHTLKTFNHGAAKYMLLFPPPSSLKKPFFLKYSTQTPFTLQLRNKILIMEAFKDIENVNKFTFEFLRVSLQKI